MANKIWQELKQELSLKTELKFFNWIAGKLLNVICPLYRDDDK